MLTAKFLRAHNVATGVNGLAWFFRVVYEFYGFCVNGDVSLSAPGAAAFPSGAFATLPPAFSTAGLLNSGSDGFTAVGEPFFSTVGTGSFNPAWVNKYLVTWQSGSISSDDSIYQITQWFNSSSIRVNVLQGGTPYTGSLHPSFTTRSSVNWRIIDFSVPAGLVYSNTGSLVLQFSDAGNVNPGQANSQAGLRLVSTYGGGTNVGITLSPSGSWQLISGTWQFTDPTTELEATSNSGGWGSPLSPAYISLWAAGDFIISHFKASGQNAADGFHIEVPQRLYSSGDDPNPIAMMNFGLAAPDQIGYYATGFHMHHPPNNTTQAFFGLGRSVWGDTFFGNGTNLQAVTNGRYNNSWFNTYQNKFLFTDATLGLFGIPQQFCLARVRLRRARFLPPIIPQFQRVGNNGEWLHVVNGIMWPWDNSLLPYNLFLGGN